MRENINSRMLELFDDTTPGEIRRHGFNLDFLTDYHRSYADRLIKNNAACFILRVLTSIGMIYGFSLLYIEITKLNFGWAMHSLPLFVVGMVFVMAFMVYMHETNKRNYLRRKHYE
jgi:hypothetical protein